nr:zona pellucida sperm-binding protein 3 isoform X3 [Gorilla gorilla gorilla]
MGIRWPEAAACCSAGTMELSYRLFICLLLWGSTELCYPQPLWLLQGGASRPETSVQPVLVECQEATLMVMVSKDLFGTGKLIRAADLTLGPEACEPLVSMDTEDVVRFEVGLHECGNSMQVTDDALVYSTFLLHDPRPVGNLSIVRTNRAEIPIECRYPSCLVDGLTDASSAFKVPRPGPDTLQFTVDVFHFANDSRNMIYITCHLKVTLAEQDPDELNKACFFSKPSNSWFPVEGPADICQCCNKGDCGTPSHSRRQPHVVSQWSRSASRNRRHVTEEADVTMGPLIFLDRSGDHEVEQWALPSDTSVVLLGVGLAVVVSLTLTAVILVLTRRCRTASHPVSASE